MEPSGSRNISQTLFATDESLMKKNVGSLATIAPYNWISSEDVGIEGAGTAQEAAYINQSRMSSYYQDNPFKNLLFANQFALPTLGGPVNGSQGSGSRPGVVITELPKKGFALLNGKYYKDRVPESYTIKTTNVNGIVVPQFMAATFGSPYRPL